MIVTIKETRWSVLTFKQHQESNSVQSSGELLIINYTHCMLTKTELNYTILHEKLRVYFLQTVYTMTATMYNVTNRQKRLKS